MRGWSRAGARGGTLIEVVLAVALLGILAASSYAVLAAQTARTASLGAQWQALALAQSMLAEVQAQPVTTIDPDGGPDSVGPEPGEARGSTLAPFDHVNDYDGLVISGDQIVASGMPRPAWAGYTLTVAVRAQAWAGVPDSEAWWITVRVRAPDGAEVVLAAVRTAAS